MLKYFYNPLQKNISSRIIDLDTESISISTNTGIRINVPLKELLGCKIFPSINKDLSPRMEVYYTNLKIQQYGKGGIDQLEHREIKTETIFSEKLDELTELRKNILNKLYSTQKEKFIQRICQVSGDIYYKKALVFLNPKGGKGKALSLFQNYKNILKVMVSLLMLLKLNQTLLQRIM